MSIIQGTAKSGGTVAASFYDYPIGDSLRFDGSSYLSRTPSTAGNQRTWSFSCWVKRSVSEQHNILTAYTSASDTTNIAFDYGSGENLQWYDYSSGYRIQLTSTQKFRDVAGWYHLLFALDTNQATSSYRAKIYVNGVRVTDFVEEIYPSQNADLKMNTTIQHRIGNSDQHDRTFAGYMSDVYFIDGQALDPYFFGEFKDNIWVPYNAFSTAGSGTATASDGGTATDSYGTNGFRLAFDSADFNWSGSSTMTDPYGSGTAVPIYGVADASGNGKHWVMNS